MKQFDYTLGILLFDEVEVLDFCGPFEVFSVARHVGKPIFEVVTIAEKSQISTRGGLKVIPDFALYEEPKLDILIVPGGQGTRREINNPRLIEWIKSSAIKVELLLSVCSGSLLLAKAGLLDGLKATTHHNALELLRSMAPATEILPEERFIDNGRVIVSAGISAGIDMSLYVVGRLMGSSVAEATAAHMEYDYRKV